MLINTSRANFRGNFFGVANCKFGVFGARKVLSDLYVG